MNDIFCLLCIACILSAELLDTSSTVDGCQDSFPFLPTYSWRKLTHDIDTVIDWNHDYNVPESTHIPRCLYHFAQQTAIRSSWVHFRHSLIFQGWLYWFARGILDEGQPYGARWTPLTSTSLRITSQGLETFNFYTPWSFLHTSKIQNRGAWEVSIPISGQNTGSKSWESECIRLAYQTNYTVFLHSTCMFIMITLSIQWEVYYRENTEDDEGSATIVL